MLSVSKMAFTIDHRYCLGNEKTSWFQMKASHMAAHLDSSYHTSCCRHHPLCCRIPCDHTPLLSHPLAITPPCYHTPLAITPPCYHAICKLAEVRQGSQQSLIPLAPRPHQNAPPLAHPLAARLPCVLLITGDDLHSTPPPRQEHTR